MAESDFHNGHAVLEQGSMGKMSREKMVYMAVKDPSQEEADMSKSLYSLSLLCVCLSLSLSLYNPSNRTNNHLCCNWICLTDVRWLSG